MIIRKSLAILLSLAVLQAGFPPVSLAAGPGTNVLISEDRTFTTASGGASPITVQVTDNNDPGLVLGPQPTVWLDETQNFSVAVRTTGTGVSVTAAGIPSAVFTPNHYGAGTGIWYWNTDNTHAGTYSGTITATDTAGHQVIVPLTLRIRNSWHREEIIYWRPAPVPAQTVNNPIVSGQARFTVAPFNYYRIGTPMPTNAVYQYLLDDLPIGPIVTGNGETVLDFSAIPDGTHALSVRPIDGPDLSQVRLSPLQFIVDNVPGPVTGNQRVPLVQFYAQINPGALDWVTYPGTRPRSAALPLPYRRSEPAYTMSRPDDLLDAKNWMIEGLNQNTTNLNRGNPTFYNNARGDVVTFDFYPKAGGNSEGSFEITERHDDFDGPRPDNSYSPYSTFVPNPAGTGWVGLEIAGSLRRVDIDGTVTTLAGYRRRTDVLPYLYKDATIPMTAFRADKEQLIGNFVGNIPFLMPVDLAFDPRDTSHNTLYVADTGNHRIAKVVLGGSQPVITTVAGMPRVSGYRDGAAGQALFNSPYSIAFKSDGTLYIADMMNSAIRKLSPDGSTVTTIAGGSLAPAVPSRAIVEANPETYLADGPFNQAFVTYPQVLRLDSHDNIIIGELMTGTIRRANLATGRMERIHTVMAGSPEWLWLDVDRHGNIGPKDDIVVAPAVALGNVVVLRISADGSRVGKVISGGGAFSLMGQGSSVSEPLGHYPWAIAIDDDEARLIATGFGSTGLISVRRFMPGDPPFTHDGNMMARALDVWETGTVAGFPNGSRPSFVVVHGWTGHNRLGMVPDFDEIANWSDAQLASYIQNGMGGSVPRPEITGNDLSALMDFIRRNSLKGLAQSIPLPVRSSDIVAPVVQNIQAVQLDASTVRVLWQTNEPTLGLAQWGLSPAYHGWSDIESAYGTSHSVLIKGLPANKPVHIAVRSKDQAGNQTLSANQTMILDPAASGGTVPNGSITNPQTTGLTTTSVTLTWDTTEPSTSQVEYGFNTTYGFQTSVDTALVTHHSVTLTNLVPGTLYHYRTISSNRAIGPVDTQLPTAPTNLVLNNPTATSLLLSWTASTDDLGVSGYRLDLSLDAGFSSIITGYRDLDLGNVTVRTLSGLSPGVQYYARLRAYDVVSKLSGYSAMAQGSTSGSTQPPPPNPPPGNPPALPALSLAAFDRRRFALNEAIRLDYHPDPSLNTSYEWRLDSTDVAAALRKAVRGGADSKALQGASAFATTAAPQFQLGGQGLTPGAYELTVTVKAQATGQILQASANIILVAADFSALRVYPNPWKKGTSTVDYVRFEGLTLGTTIKLFTVSGHFVRDARTDAATWDWDRKNDKGDYVASGIYLFVVTNGEGQKARGRIVIVR